MSRRRRERWLEAEELWPNLQQFLGCHFHQDCFLLFGTLDAALDQAIGDWTVEGRQSILREWRDWNAKEGWQNGVHAALGDAFGVDLLFESEEGARKFMNHVYDKLITSIRRDVGRDWVA